MHEQMFLVAQTPERVTAELADLWLDLDRLSSRTAQLQWYCGALKEALVAAIQKPPEADQVVPLPVPVLPIRPKRQRRLSKALIVETLAQLSPEDVPFERLLETLQARDQDITGSPLAPMLTRCAATA
jgi:hypothetical protein